jgi:hypothetical protein
VAIFRTSCLRLLAAKGRHHHGADKIIGLALLEQDSRTKLAGKADNLADEELKHDRDSRGHNNDCNGAERSDARSGARNGSIKAWGQEES